MTCNTLKHVCEPAEVPKLGKFVVWLNLNIRFHFAQLNSLIKSILPLKTLHALLNLCLLKVQQTKQQQRILT